MAFTNVKRVAKSDRIEIDGTEVSNAFRRFGLTGEHSVEDSSGFSEDGFDESLAGSTSVEFSGEAFYSEEIADIIYPIWESKEVVSLYWQPNGLADGGARAYWADVQIFTFGPENQRGSISVMPFSARIAANTGLESGDGT